MTARKRNDTSPPVPAKISAPRLSDVYERTALFRTLDTACKKRLVWFAAPAGAGKTSGVTTYLKSRRLPFLWYNVDARDGDVANLFHFLTLAAKLASRRRKLRLSAFSVEHQAGISAFARGFFEDLCRQRPAPSVIVLDDYQDAKSDLFDDVVREAINALPRGITAIVISRAEPPPSLARLAASADCAFLRTDDLRLTPRETLGLIRVYRPDLRGAELKRALPRITELTNGWAAALTLLLQTDHIAGIDHREVSEFSDRLFDYFAAEIFDRATPGQRELLLKTSVVPSLTSTVAARLTGNEDAGRMLAELERRSFLMQRLGSSGAYRYHPLLRDFLLRRAETAFGSAAVEELHRCAAKALVEMEQIDEAMEQLETARELALRTRLILSVAPSYVAKGRGRTIEAWIGRLPADCLESNGWLLYWQGVCCMPYANARPRALLELAYARFTHDRDVLGLYLACAAALQAVVHEGGDFSHLDPWIERVEALEKSGLPCPPQFELMVATGMALASSMRLMDTSYHRKWIERATTLAARSEDIEQRTLTGGFMAIYIVLFRNYFDSAVIVETLRAAAHAAESSTVAQLTFMQADALCLWACGNNHACLALVRDALAVAARTGVFAWNNFLHGVGVAAALALDDAPAAREFLASLAEAAELRGGWQAGFYFFNAGWDALVRGEGTLALYYAERAQRSAETVGPPFGRVVAPFAVAQSLACLGRKQEAVAALDTAGRLARSAGCELVLHACLLVEADLFWQEDRPRALVSLRKGFALARAHGYHTMYWLSPQLLARAAVRALENDIEPDHVRTTITRRQLAPDPAPVHLEAWPWRYRLYALGTFEVRREVEFSAGAPGTMGARQAPVVLKGKPRELLQALVACGGRAVRETELIDALWPEAQGDTGRRVFDTTLHRLRRQLGDERVVSLSSGRVSLEEHLCSVDVWALDAIMLHAKNEIARGADAAVLARLTQRLLAVYRGPLLSELDDAISWAEQPRQRLRSKFVGIAASLGRALEDACAFDTAIALYEHALDAEPLAESMRAALTRCLATVSLGLPQLAGERIAHRD
jgi:tetratricopeptide (TPR) repeat protein